MPVYASIKSHGPNTNVLVVLWDHIIGPIHLDGIYKNRAAARKAATNILGPDRVIVNINKLYQIHTNRFVERFYTEREKKQEN